MSMATWLQDARSFRPCLRAQTVRTSCRPGAVLDALWVLPGPALLESTAFHERYGRYSVLACRPVETVTLRTGRLTDSAGREVPGRTVMNALRGLLSCVLPEGTCPVPYGPGWIGYVGYEFGRHLERLPGRAVRDTSLPDLRLAFYDAVAVHDAGANRWHLCWLESDDPRWPGRAGRGGPDDPLTTLRDLLASSPGGTEQTAPEAAAPPGAPAPAAQSNFTPEGYRRAVARCIEYIAAGDIFQVNLSQRFTVEDAPEPLTMYRALRRRNPACYSGFLLLEGAALLSSSPELFLRVRGGSVLTRPIKGTRRRTGDPAADARSAEELLSSEKDNAELAMIIDLLRNDLGRVCRYGSVRVANPRELEAHPTVFHLVGSVTGQLYDGKTAADLLAATFPGGSITGAPKIRAMEIIDELEGVARGVYTGCIGWFGVNGDCELNIAIRTIVCDGGRAYAQVGGGIVADSTPEGEYQETLDKARALLEAIGMARAAGTAPAGAPDESVR